MKKSSLLFTATFFAYTILVGGNCNRQPFIPDYSNIKGFVIGKETCNANEALDYWLIDFTYLPNAPQVGDTLVLKGIKYTNVLKTKELDPLIKQTGLLISIDYKTITSNKVTTSGCTVAAPVIYPLKEIFIIYQGEIR